MSFVEGSKSKFFGIAANLGNLSAQASHHLKPGCVQCGSLLDLSERGKGNFSGKCFSCENWVSDEDEEFEELAD